MSTYIVTLNWIEEGDPYTCLPLVYTDEERLVQALMKKMDAGPEAAQRAIRLGMTRLPDGKTLFIASVTPNTNLDFDTGDDLASKLTESPSIRTVDTPGAVMVALECMFRHQVIPAETPLRFHKPCYHNIWEAKINTIVEPFIHCAEDCSTFINVKHNEGAGFPSWSEYVEKYRDQVTEILKVPDIDIKRYLQKDHIFYPIKGFPTKQERLKHITWIYELNGTHFVTQRNPQTQLHEVVGVLTLTPPSREVETHQWSVSVAAVPEKDRPEIERWGFDIREGVITTPMGPTDQYLCRDAEVRGNFEVGKPVPRRFKMSPQMAELISAATSPELETLSAKPESETLPLPESPFVNARPEISTSSAKSQPETLALPESPSVKPQSETLADSPIPDESVMPRGLTPT